MQILLTGSLAVDQIMSFDGSFAEMIQPEKLHVLSLSVLIKELRRTRGGIAGNIAYSLALLGEKPLLFGSIGTDQKEYMSSLKKIGVDTSCLHYSEKPTASFSVITDRNDCQVGGFYPGAMSDATALSLKKFRDQDIFVVLSAHDPKQMKQQVAECIQLKKRLFYDVGQQASNISGEDIREGIDAAELLIVNDYEMGILVQKSGWSEKEIRQKVNACVVTFGAEGSQIYDGDTSEKIHACSLEKVVDPTGAGDAFRAGFLYGYVRDWQLKQCAQLGSVIAAYAVEHLGTQSHTFTLNEVIERYVSTYHQEISFS